MKTLLFFVGIIVVTFTINVNGADSDYDFQNDVDRCVDTSDDLFNNCSENNGDCEIYQGLINITTKVESELTITQKTTLETFIETCKTEIFAVTTLTKTEKFIKFSGRLTKFSEENAQIYEIIRFQNISTWNSINIVEKVTIIKQQSLIQQTIILVNNNCPLFDGLKAAASATGNQDIIDAVNDLITNQLIDTINDGSMTFEEKIIQIYTEITQLFTSFSSFEFTCKYTEISGFGIFAQFFQSSITYKQVQMSSSIITGVFPNILLIEYLQDAFNMYKQQDIKLAIQINQFIQRVNQSMQQITDVEERMTWFANYVQQWLVLNYKFTTKYIFSIEFGAEFGSLYDFCFCPGFPGPVTVTFPTSTASTTTSIQTSTSTASASLSTSTSTSTSSLTTKPISSVKPSTGTSFGFSAESSYSTSSPFTEIPSTSSSCACVCE